MDLLSIALALLLLVESNDNASAKGDYAKHHGYKAVGCLQTWKITVDEANRILGEPVFKYSDRQSRQKSLLIARTVLKYHCRTERLGRVATVEDYVRVWRGGPDGYKKSNTKDQWRKAREHLISGDYKETLMTIVDPELANNIRKRNRTI